MKNTHAKTESNPKRKKVNIMKMIRTVLTDVLLVGLEWKIAAPQESITFNSKKKNRECRKIQRNKKRHENKKTRYKKEQNTTMIRKNILRIIRSIEQKTKTQ